MSSTIDSKPDLQPSQNGHTKPRFTLSQLFPAKVRETFIGPNKAGWATTGIYIAGAALCLGITAGFAWLNQPAAIAEYGKVGQKFFAEFVDPTLATSLEVSTFDTNSVEPREFNVEKSDNGQWVIPSHHDYPADAEEQLANTAASVIGIERGAMVTRWSADHAKYGVVNPKQDTLGVDEVDGVGQRLTLRGDNDSVLADFIVGDQVESEFDQYYVRHPEEDEVYITTLNVDLSTKFTDWIDTDLFDLSTSDVRRVTVNDYSFDELSGKLTQSEISELTRDDSGNDWNLVSIENEKEEINKDAIADTLSEIAGLEITGVRPKQEGLTPDLKLDQQALKSQAGVQRLQADLLSSGFLLQPAEGDDKDQLKLIAREGELMAGTKDGLVYRLHFGRAFAGSQQELEVGFVSTAAPANSESTEAGTESSETETSDLANDESSSNQVDESIDSSESATGEDTDSKPGRYVFVRVDFNKSLLGDEPIKPAKPAKSERLIELEEQQKAESTSESEDTSVKASETPTEPAGSEQVASNEEGESTSDSSGATTTGQEQSTDGEATEDKSTKDESTEADNADKADETKTPEQTELEKLRIKFEAAKSKYDSDLKSYEAFQSKIESGKSKAEELNRRFAKWFYVISGESYDKLALKRSSFVSVKETEEVEAVKNARQIAEDEESEESEDSKESEESEESEKIEEGKQIENVDQAEPNVSETTNDDDSSTSESEPLSSTEPSTSSSSEVETEEQDLVSDDETGNETASSETSSSKLLSEDRKPNSAQ